MFDKSTGRRGILFKASIVRWLSDGEVVVEAKDWTGFLNSSGARYLLRRIDGMWTVVGSDSHWVS